MYQFTTKTKMYHDFLVLFTELSKPEGYISIGRKIYYISKQHKEQASDDIIVLLDGEIYDIESPLDHIKQTYLDHGIEYLLQSLDGVFALVLIDQRAHLEEAKVYVAIDRIGLRPIHAKYFADGSIEIGTYDPPYGDSCVDAYATARIKPGCYLEYSLSSKVNSIWKPNTTIGHQHVYAILGTIQKLPIPFSKEMEDICYKAAVHKREQYYKRIYGDDVQIEYVFDDNDANRILNTAKQTSTKVVVVLNRMKEIAILPYSDGVMQKIAKFRENNIHVEFPWLDSKLIQYKLSTCGNN
jgi:hypothetical protein